MSPLGWTCSRCTYEHRVPGTRCVMCQELRITREHMRDFIAGKPIPPPDPLLAPPKGITGQECRNVMRNNPYRNNTREKLNNPQQPFHNRVDDTQTLLTTVITGNGVKPNAIRPSHSETAIPGDETNISALKRPLGGQIVGANTHQPPPDQEQQQHQPPEKSLLAMGIPAQSSVIVAGTGGNPCGEPAQPSLLPVNSSKTAKIPSIASKVVATRFQPGPVPFAPETIAEWIYPVDDNYPKRQYQIEISEVAVSYNTLVSLPTGLGKTLIAAVVLYNFYRWFPTGKVIFMAPTLPLVNQQVKACYAIMGIPTEDTAVLTGKTTAARRKYTWKERRVFFCTPQTVQRDLEAGRCDPSLVVCVVIDEAHKATGDYAYVKIVNLLAQSNAKFRILGLSATPGTNIKAIQQVIDALRINKIEARTEEDPTVARYIHKRESEIVIVPAVSATKLVERALNDLIGPLLDRLRSAGALRASGNATLTSYQLIKAREDFQKRNPGDSMTGYFIAAQTFCQIRTNLHKHGIGVVRTSLQRLRNTPQRGVMVNLIRSTAFETVWSTVEKAVGGGDTSCDGIQENKLNNNPKLTKLVEILIEHFERARVRGDSSRAIVFSQFRDSVSEIVSVLAASKPLILPRHFVGQGNGTSDGLLKGMKQAEQHQVIREFRDGIYNVLVCTCIGEEGLDIGEVDLIVNFDTLRSPIRTIQRIGRTGRKRDGRVVCLVSEGPEERTLEASRQSEKNLARALLKPMSFNVRPNTPLLPVLPQRRETKLSFDEKFRASQVEGHEAAACRKVKFDHASSTESPVPSRKSISNSWRLSMAQIDVVAKMLGDARNSNRILEIPLNFPAALRRRLLNARLVSRHVKYEKGGLVGRTSRLLRLIETSHGTVWSSSKDPDPVQRVYMRRDVSYLSLFPIYPETQPERDAYYSCLSTSGMGSTSDADQVGGGCAVTAQRDPNYPITESVAHIAGTWQEIPFVNEASSGGGMGELSIGKEPFGLCDAQMPAVSVVRPQSDVNDINETSAVSGRLPQFDRMMKQQIQSDNAVYLDPNDSGSMIMLERDLQPNVAGNEHLWGGDLSGATTQNEIHHVTNPVQFTRSIADNGSYHIVHGTVKPVADSLNCGLSSVCLSNCGDERYPTASHHEEDFLLPSPPNSSHGSDDEDAGAESKAAAQDVKPNQNEVESDFFLLSPAPSSSEDEGLESASKLHVDGPGSLLSHCDLIANTVQRQLPDRFALFATQNKKDSCNESCSSESPIHFRKQSRTKRRRVICEEGPSQSPYDPTPSTIAKTLKHMDAKLSYSSPDLSVEPRPSEGDIICAICQSGESPDEDPIILCDGPGTSMVCTVAVHTTCYSASVNLDSDEEWRCDKCDFLFRGGSPSTIVCSSCGRKDGVMKRDLGIWKHVRCPTVKLRRLGQKRSQMQVNKKTQRQPLGNIDRNSADSAERLEKRKRRLLARKFIEEEARIDSDDDIEGDDEEADDIDAIEAEEDADIDGFINDTSQLGYSPDALDGIDPDARTQELHRALDNNRVRENQFKTPVLNRLMRDAPDSEATRSDLAPDSARGLGRMHFIRSVIHHHRDGGDAEDVEQFYKAMEDKGTPIDEVDLIPTRKPPERIIEFYQPSDSDDE